MKNKNIDVSQIGMTFKNLGGRMITLNFISVFLLFLNALFNIGETFVMKDFLISLFAYGFSILLIANFIIFIFSRYVGNIIVDLSQQIKSIEVPEKNSIKINYHTFRSALDKSDELIEMKNNFAIIGAVLNPLFLLSFMLGMFSSFIYVFISFLILIF